MRQLIFPSVVITVTIGMAGAIVALGVNVDQVARERDNALRHAAQQSKSVMELATRLKQVEAQLDETAAQLQTKSAVAATQAEAAKSATLDKQTLESQLSKSRQETADVTKERDAAVAAEKALNEQLAAAKKEAADAKKLALLDAHNTCPPPTADKAPAKRELAPRVKKSNGEFEWPQDFDKACEVARKMHRLVLPIFVTDACPHCHVIARDVLPVKQVCNEIFARYVPVYVMVDHKNSREYEIADEFGVNQFKYPAVGIYNPETKSMQLFRPKKTPDEFLAQVEAEACGP